ncbi:MAG: protein kinase domain-containing protein [Bryobacteraceae bacterium]
MSEFWRQLEGTALSDSRRLVRLLGESPRSAVFLADDAGKKRAVKFVRPEPGADRQLNRWQAAPRLSHPHLVSIFESGRTTLAGSEMLYAVMEYGEEALNQVLTERPLSIDETKEMLGPCLEALGYLHANGVAHSRLRPSNILAVEERLKISSDGALPFGETLRPDGPHTAPEGSSSAPADVWSLGVTLVEVLSQSLPQRGKPVPIPEPFAELARACLQEDPVERWTIPMIREKLHPSGRAGASSAKVFRYAVGTALALGVLAAFVVPRFLGTAPTVRVPPAAEPAAPAPEPPPVAVDTRPAPAPGKEPEVERKQPAPDQPEAEPRGREKGAEPAAGSVVRQRLPDVAPESLRTITGTLRVGVGVVVDEAGNVSSATLDSAGPSRYFAGLSQRAAREWKFTPGAPGRWRIRFEYTSNEVRATAVPRRSR